MQYLFRQFLLIIDFYQFTMNQLKITILSICFFMQAHSQSIYNLYKHPSDSAAKCIDGSPSALYISQGQSDKILLYFQGGGMCYGMTLSQTIENCYSRSKTSLGSSINYNKTADLNSFTIMSNNQKNNPLYYNWTKVYIPYCDGVLHQGNRQAPIDYKQTKLYLRGMNNTFAHFKYLDEKYNFFNAKKVVLSGTSAGAMAALAWSNTVYNQMRNKDGLLVIFDSGQFVSDYFNPFTNSTPGVDAYKFIKTLAFTEQLPPYHECLQVQSRQNCEKFGVLVNYIKPSIFAIESQYDVFAIRQILLLKCPQMSFPATLQKCNSTQMQVIEDYRQKSLDSFKNLTKYSKNGIWAVSCSQHGFLYNYIFYNTDYYLVPKKEGKTILSALIDFVEGSQPKNYIDLVSWPHNEACSGYSNLHRASLVDE